MQGSRVITHREAHDGYADGHNDKAARRASSKSNAAKVRGEPRIDRSKKRKAWQRQ